MRKVVIATANAESIYREMLRELNKIKDRRLEEKVTLTLMSAENNAGDTDGVDIRKNRNRFFEILLFSITSCGGYVSNKDVQDWFWENFKIG